MASTSLHSAAGSLSATIPAPACAKSLPLLRKSVRMAMEMMQRLQLPDESIALVEFLIRHHTRMSIIAFRRDTDDPEIVRQLADLVGTEERLKMLCLLTLVDVEAVNPDTLTPWREELLWRRALASNSPNAYWNYLNRYPNGVHAVEAQQQLEVVGGLLVRRIVAHGVGEIRDRCVDFALGAARRRSLEGEDPEQRQCLRRAPGIVVVARQLLECVLRASPCTLDLHRVVEPKVQARRLDVLLKRLAKLNVVAGAEQCLRQAAEMRTRGPRRA